MTGLGMHRAVGSRNLRPVLRPTGPGEREILNAFKYGLTNNPTEFNNKIKVLNGVATELKLNGSGRDTPLYIIG